VTETSAEPSAQQRAGLRLVLVVLCVTEITSWGVLYHAFPVLSSAIAAGTGWSLSALTAAFSVSQILAALVGVVVGRLLDRHVPIDLMPDVADLQQLGAGTVKSQLKYRLPG
jgi:hypothetical protein